MAGPHSQISLFDLPASAGEAPEGSPAPAQEPAVTPQPDLSQAEHPAPEMGPQPELPSPQTGTIGYFEDEDADVPTLPQPQNMVTEPEPALQLPEPLPEPEMQPGFTSSQAAEAAEPIQAEALAAPLDELALDEVPEQYGEHRAEVAAEPQIAVVEPDQLQSAPAPTLVAFEEADGNDKGVAANSNRNISDAEAMGAVPVPVAAQSQEAQEPASTPEPRPIRPILAFDIEPLGAAAPEDIPREFLSGKPLTGQPKPKSTRGRKSTKATEAGPDKILVPEDEELFKRQYYPISEVAIMFGVNISQIRYWENEFPQLKPRKNGKGDRLFRPEDVKTLVLIHDLIRRRKYTLEGAKEFLKVNNGEDVRFPLIQQLQKLKGFLNELRANL